MYSLRPIRKIILIIVAISIIFSAFALPNDAAKPQIWNLKNADIRAVIQTISVITGKNFIVDPRVQGQVTLVSQTPLSPNELYQVFLSMLHTLQYSAVSSGNVIQIVPATDANALSRQIATDRHPGSGDDVVVRVVPLNFVSASELVPMLRPLMMQSDNITAYMPTNALILAASASNIARLMAIIHQMDQTELNHIDVVHLRYANAKKLVDVVHSLQESSQAQGKVSNVTLAADADSNSILMSGNLANQMMMHRLIQQLDQKDSESDDTQVVQLNYLTAKTFAPILMKIAQGMSDSQQKSDKDLVASSSHAISVQSEPDNNAIIMRAPKTMLSHLLRVIQRLDVRPQEVLVEAIIVKVDENLLNQLGIVWGTRDLDLDGTPGASNASDNSSEGSVNNTFALKVNRSGVGLLPSSNLVALIHLLKSNGSTEVLSTPSVVVLNNQKAIIDDGQNVGVANRSYQGVAETPGVQSNTASFNTIERKNVTLSLAVMPHISPNDMIRLGLVQQDDSIANGEGTDNPTLNTSTIKTTVLVKSGDILVLGGLINNEKAKEKQKIPILGDIPLLGKIFSYDTNKAQKRSLMVFIRPIIMSKQSAQSQTQDRYAYIRQLSTQDLPKLSKNHRLAKLPAPQKTAVKSE